VCLADETADYRRAWGEWSAVKLTRVLGPIDGLAVEAHTGTPARRTRTRSKSRYGAAGRSCSLHWPGCGWVISFPGTTGQGE